MCPNKMRMSLILQASRQLPKHTSTNAHQQCGYWAHTEGRPYRSDLQGAIPSAMFVMHLKQHGMRMPCLNIGLMNGTEDVIFAETN